MKASGGNDGRPRQMSADLQKIRPAANGWETQERPPAIAVAIPCFNEAVTIAKVVDDFRRALPGAAIHVFDNNSSDGSGEIAAQAGAVVHFVPGPGKGEVVRAIFRDIGADVLVMVDGDDTYAAGEVHQLIAPVMSGKAEMVVGTRLGEAGPASFRPMHVFGNRLVLRCINTLFGTRLSDVLSGYRAFSRRFAKTMPVLSRGFEIETEITLHALEHRQHIVEVPLPYQARPSGSASKLSTLHDGQRVLTTLFRLYKDYRPLMFFGLPGVALLAAGILAGSLVIGEFVDTGRVAGIARAVFAVSCVLVGMVALATGLILDTVNRRARELYVMLADHVVDRRRSPRGG
jgi:glycosyltransferase involved in cell wall biosynthesis